MRVSLLALLLVMAASDAQAETADAYVAGIGLVSCARWLSSPEMKRDGENWLLGYLTFVDPKAKYPRRIASLPNIDALLDEARGVCAEKTDTTLFEAADRVRHLIEIGAIQLTAPSNSPLQK